MIIYKVCVNDKGKIDSILKDEEEYGEVKYIVSFSRPKRGKKLSEYFSYDNFLESKNVILRYNQV